MILLAITAGLNLEQQSRNATMSQAEPPRPIPDAELRRMISGNSIVVRGVNGQIVGSEGFSPDGRYTRGGAFMLVTSKYIVRNSSICITDLPQGGLTCTKVVRKNKGDLFYEATVGHRTFRTPIFLIKGKLHDN